MRRAVIFLMLFGAILGFKNLALAAPSPEKSEDKWLIYWYISGNDLENTGSTDSAAATEDLQEMVNQKFISFDEESVGGKVNLPIHINHDVQISPNIKILIQTGGCKGWLTEEIPDNTIGRYLYDNNGFHYQGSFADADMGKPQTLESFLRYGKDTIEKDFRPNHRMFIFWNHGGLVGVCYDERFTHEENDDDSFLDLNDIHQAFSKVYRATPNNPPFDIIGFDACIRATYENANNIYGFARYMVASEENESFFGWYYSDWIKELSKNPSMRCDQLGKLICQSSFDYLDERDASESTFSVVDLSPEKWLPLRKAYNSFNKNYLKSVNKDPYVYITLEAAAKNAEHYAEEGSSGFGAVPGLMIDLKGLAEGTKTHLTYDVDSSIRKVLTQSANDLSGAIDSAVVYNVSGKNRAYSNGISTYYPLSKDGAEFELYASQKITLGHTKELYENLIKIPAQIENENGTADSPDSRTTRSRKRDSTRSLDAIFDLSDLQNLRVNINEDTDNVFVELTQEQMKKISGVTCSIARDIEDGDPEFGIKDIGLLFLGISSNIKSELTEDNNYRFTDNFQASWPMLNNHLVFAVAMEARNDQLNEAGEVVKNGYAIYGIPIVLNDAPCLLRVAHYPNEGRYQIVGARRNARRGVGRTGRGFIELKKGDKVVPIFVALIPEEDNDDPDAVIRAWPVDDMKLVLKAIQGQPFTLDETPVVSDEIVKDGDYVYQFNFNSPRGNFAYSESARFDVFKGEVLYAEREDTPEDNEKIKIEMDGEEYTYDPATKEIVEND